MYYSVLEPEIPNVAEETGAAPEMQTEAEQNNEAGAPTAPSPGAESKGSPKSERIH